MVVRRRFPLFFHTHAHTHTHSYAFLHITNDIQVARVMGTVYCEAEFESLIQKNFVLYRTPSQGNLYTGRLIRSFIPRLRIVIFSVWYSFGFLLNQLIQ